MNERLKKILIVCPSNRGTIALCTLNLWKALKKITDADVKCVLIYRLSGGFSEFDGCDYYVENNPAGGLKALFKIGEQVNWLRKVKREFKPLVTVSTLFNTSTISILSGGKDKKIGIFHSPHWQAKAAGKISYLITLAIYNLIYPLLNRIFCVSTEVEKSIVQSFHAIRKSSVSVVYNAHDIDKIKLQSEEELESAEEREIFNGSIYLYIGRFDRNKAPERAMKAFAKASLSDDSKLVYIGGGDLNYELELKSLAATLGISDKVFILGRKNNPYKYLALSKALISSSFSEGLPGVMIEAMILGKPVVTTNSSEGIWEILSCHENYSRELKENWISEFGIITPNGENENQNIVNLADAISQIDKKEFCTQISPFIEKVSFDTIAHQYSEVIDTL